MKKLVLSLAFAVMSGCGGEQPPATEHATKKLTPTAITVQITPKIEGLTVYAGYYGPGLPPGDAGYIYKTGVTKAAGLTFTVPGSAVCGNAFTTAKALDGVPIAAGVYPHGMELKFAMPNGWTAGMPGQTPGDNEVATIVVDGQTLAPLPIMTYTGNDNRNLFISSWLFGCTP